MRTFSLLPITSLILGITAATIPRQSDPHIVDFRTYGVAGCLDENQGVYTYLQSDENICRTFADSQIGSIFTLDITDGCFGERLPGPSSTQGFFEGYFLTLAPQSMHTPIPLVWKIRLRFRWVLPTAIILLQLA